MSYAHPSQTQTQLQLATAVKNGFRPIVTFTAKADELEAYPEQNTRARVIRAEVRPSEDVVVLTVDYAEFDAHNRAFESANYYDAQRNPTLTVREANKYEPEERLYFGCDDVVESWMQVATDGAAALHSRYTASGTAVPYVTWLEQQVLAIAA